MDHYSDPQNKHQPPKEGYEKVHMHSDNCIDDLDIFLLVEKQDLCNSAKEADWGHSVWEVRGFLLTVAPGLW